MSQHLDSMPTMSEVGAFDCSKTLASVDLNNITATGNYILTGNITNSYGGTNYGYLQVYRYDDNNIRQVGTPMNSDRMFLRNKYNGTWGSWEELALNSKINGEEITITRDQNRLSAGSGMGWVSGRIAVLSLDITISATGGGSGWITVATASKHPPTGKYFYFQLSRVNGESVLCQIIADGSIRIYNPANGTNYMGQVVFFV